MVHLYSLDSPRAVTFHRERNSNLLRKRESASTSQDLYQSIGGIAGSPLVLRFEPD